MTSENPTKAQSDEETPFMGIPSSDGAFVVYQNTVAMVNLVLDDLSRATGEGLEPDLCHFVLELHLDGAIPSSLYALKNCAAVNKKLI